MKRWQIWMRNAARAVGVTRLLRWTTNRELSRYRREYQQQRPDRVLVGEDDLAGEFLAADESEYANLRQKEKDCEILRIMTDALPEGGCCWDVGANIGVYSVIAARAVGSAGRVLAFEPEPSSRLRLLANIANNGLSNVDVAPVALGGQEGTLRMLRGTSTSAGTHRLLQDEEMAARENTLEVRVVRGDVYRQERNLPEPTLIKIDVEGAELDVLKGLSGTLRAPGCQTVVCEVHFAILQSRGQSQAPLQIVKHLNECGFDQVTWIDHSHLAAFKTHV